MPEDALFPHPHPHPHPARGLNDMGSASQLVGTALLVGGAATLVAVGSSQGRAHLPELGVRRTVAGTRLGGRTSSFAFLASHGTINVRSVDGRVPLELVLSLVVNGNARPLTIGRQDLRAAENNAFGAAITVPLGGEDAGALFDLHVDPATDALVIQLHMEPRAPLAASHAIAIRAETPMRGRTAFVSGVGELADLGAVNGSNAVLDVEGAPLGFTSARGPIAVATSADDGSRDRTAPLRLSVTSAEATFDGTKLATAELRVALGANTGKVWRALYETADVPTKKVKGVVTGTGERAHVFGLDSEGLPRVRLRTEEGGRFEVDVPVTVTQWYAALDPTRTSAPISFTPGTPWDLRLDVSPGGELGVRIIDADTGTPLVSRLIVHGIDGTLDPSFGPDYRASGAGPIIDSRRGELATPLPAGKYRVSATKGIEWTIDAKEIEIVGGRSAATELALRHVVPTPGTVGCDLHVHARPSFDAPVSAEDRVLSLVSAGVEFAVPSEHNIVGDYGPALEAQDLNGQLAFVTGVEVTTFNPRFGHFGIFPYPPGPAPPYRGTNVNAIFAAAHRGDPSRVLVVHHPRLQQAIGYFEIFGWNPQQPVPPPRMRTDFDAIEVYNGYEASRMHRVDAVLHDFFALLNLGRHYAATGSSDSHRIQYTWAGYPRTMVNVGPAAAGEGGRAIDTAAVVAAVKKGRAVVTSGPMIELTVQGAHPGDEITTYDAEVSAQVAVRAAPWIDVSSLEVIVGGQEVKRIAVASRPTQTGAEPGTLEEAASRTLRYEGEVRVPIGADSTWMLVIARGARAMDDVLPFMPVVPLAFTNPIWITRPDRPMPQVVPQSH